MTEMAFVVAAALLAGLAGWLLFPPGARVTRLLPRRLPAVAVAVVGVVVVLSGVPVQALLLCGVVGAAFGLRGRSRRRVAAAETGARIQLACEGLASSLAAGVPVEKALEVVTPDWPPLAVVTGSVRLGGSVPASLRELARGSPGAADLGLVAAAWQVAERGGAGLAPAIASIAATLRRRQATRRLVRAELSSARATARLLAGLPVLTLAMGSGVGGEPVRFLMATPPGLVCLASGLLLGVAGLAWIEAIAGAVEADS